MHGVTGSIDIRRSVDDVFAVIDDPAGYDRFFVGVEHWRPLRPPGHAVGDRYHIIMRGGAVTAGATVEITERVPGAVLAWRAVDGPAHTGRWTVTRTPDGTNVSLAFTLSLPGLTHRVVEWLATSIVRRHITAVLECLRHRCEYELPAAAAGRTRGEVPAGDVPAPVEGRR